MSIVLEDHIVVVIREFVALRYGIHKAKMTVQGASKNGDSYSGDVYRVIVTDDRNDDLIVGDGLNTAEHRKNREIRFITKTPPRSKLRRQLYNTSRHFSRELYTYRTILPAFESFQLQYLARSEIFKNYPRIIAGSADENKEFVILEDLYLEKFYNSYRPTPLSYKKCLAVIKALARFHAVSFAFKDQHPDEFQRLTHPLNEITFMDGTSELLDQFLSKNVDCAITTLTSSKDDLEVKRRLKEFQKVYEDSMVECVSAKDDAVILHGDCWMSNILFKERTKEPEIKLLDWQVTRFGSPAIDLSYFIFCCTDANLRGSLQKILRYYHQELTKRITELGSDRTNPISLAKLEWHMKKYARFGLGMALMTLHTTTCDPNDMPNVVQVLDNSDFTQMENITNDLVTRSAYKKRMSGVCRDMVKFGYL